MKKLHSSLCFVLILSLFELASADTAVNKATQNDKAFIKYGLTGKGVIVAILDRGIDYTHPDFLYPNGTTRIRMMWDMSNVNPNLPICDPGQPSPIVYTQAQINQALKSHTALGERDAVGHGTVSTGLAAGNGRAALPGSSQWAGMAPNADLLIVKMTSEGAPAHSGQAAENPFQGCMSLALDLVSAEAAVLKEPIVALMDSGTQWGPIDGTSVVSQKIAADFGANTQGRVYVAASGDEGSLPNHASAAYSSSPAIFTFVKANTSSAYLQLWYTGAVPANVTLTMNDTATSVVVTPGNGCASSPDSTIVLCASLPGQQFYPWTSSGPDRAVWMNIKGHSGTGTINVTAAQFGSGIADAYGDATIPTPIISYTNNLTLGRLNDYSSTSAALVDGCFNVRTQWTDINNNPQSFTSQGATGGLWLYSSGGPTRDGRSPIAATYGGVDFTTPGGNSFAAYSPTSYWGDVTLFPFNQIQGGKGFYGRHSATSASAPIAVGGVALLLQMNPKLTPTAVRQYIHQSAISDSFSGTTPNLDWGAGKLNVLGAADLVAAAFHTNPVLSMSLLSFSGQKVGTVSAPQSITFSNTGAATDALGISSIMVSGDFVVGTNTCKANLPAGSQCTISITFKPTKTGTRNGALTIKDFNINSPHVATLSGTGT
ncbi:MAG: S8 family serine peptidase [Acidobacteriota bacterium]|nr:S8 family serine peptidase [Acidobacteriota bacterium]